MAGQVTYHLLTGAGITRAPWAITTIVSCLPVLVLAMGTTLAHMLRHDALARAAGEGGTGQSGCWSASWSSEDQARTGPDQSSAEGLPVPDPPAVAGQPSARDHHLAAVRTSEPDPRAEPSSAEQARLLARRLAAAGRSVSRRALRSGGIRGSNEALNRLARKLNAELASATTPPAGI